MAGAKTSGPRIRNVNGEERVYYGVSFDSHTWEELSRLSRKYNTGVGRIIDSLMTLKTLLPDLREPMFLSQYESQDRD